MIFDTLISSTQLASALATAEGKKPVILDCGFDLSDAEAGRQAYMGAHLPGARYVHLESDLSAGKTGRNGRHPLPSREDFAARMAALGVGDEDQVVVYDDAAGMYAARLWWMLRWAGHRACAVLDGGLSAWKAAGYTTESGPVPPGAAGRFSLREPLVTTLAYADVQANIGSGARVVVDARAPDRFRGENETLDPVGGHIPGARNRFFRANLEMDGRFKPASRLRQEFEVVAAGRPASALVSQCGSGVTACHNLLAMEIAGLTGAALYPGSWSEWSAQPGAPVATGPANPT
ncbi:MAG: sulfurtransferase [Pseudomonadota bacterium]